MAYKQTVSFGAVLMLALLCSACQDESFLRNAPGHYEGFVVNGLEQASISADIQKTRPRELSVVVRERPIAGRVSRELARFSIQTLSLKKNRLGCFEVDSSTKICPHADASLDIDSQGSHFVLDQMPALPAARWETPRVYSLSELLERAGTQGFDARIQFKSAAYAAHIARNAELRLAPSFNINTVLNIVSLNLLTMIRSAGDLVPFFLPSHVYQAQALRDQATAEADAYRVMQASATHLVRGMALEALRDALTLDSLQENRLNILQTRDQVLTAVRGGGLQRGSEVDIELALNSMDLLIQTMESGLQKKYLALSVAAGFANPQAIAGLEPITAPALAGTPEDGQMQQAAALDWAEAAVHRSQELLEMNHLIDAAGANENAREYQWIDPSGDPMGNLGAGFGEYVKAGGAAADVIKEKRKKAEAQIREKVYEAFADEQQNYDAYFLAVQAARLDEEKIVRLLFDFSHGIDFVMSDLSSALQDKAKNDIAQIQGRFAALALDDELDFLAFKGIYAAFLN